MNTNKTFIFGYGSLLNFDSIKKTIFGIDNCNNMLPDSAVDFDDNIQIVKIKNLKRGWYFHCDFTTNKTLEPWTALCAYECENYTCNGTLFPVNKEQILLLDLRESGYIKKILNNENITIIKGSGVPKDSIVYYYSLEPTQIKTPNPTYPITQTYVDLCIEGCIQIDNLLENKDYEFTKEFISTTHDWKNKKFFIPNRNIEQSNEHIDLIDKILDDIVY